MTLSIGIITADLIAAGHAIAEYENGGIKDIKNIAAYHLQQATEKIIKLQIYAKVNNPDLNKLYTHNIEKLIVYADSLKSGIQIPQFIRDRRLEITEWEAGSRYDLGFSIRIDVLKRAQNEIQKWLNCVKQAGIS